MDPNKLRRFLFEKDKQNPSAINPTGVSSPSLGSHNLGSNNLSVPSNKSAPGAISPGLPNPMGIHQSIFKQPTIGMPKSPAAPKMTLPNPTAAPSIVGQQPKLPKMAKFAKTRNYLKK